MEAIVEEAKVDRYPAYKDSGVEWLGEIPAHWKVVSLGSLLELKSDKNHPEYEVLSVYREYGVIPKDSRNDNHNATSLDTSNYKAVAPGDLVVNKMKAWQGSMGISAYRGIVSPAYITCSVTSREVVSEYIHQLLRSYSYIGEYNRISYGVRVGQWDMHYEDFKKVITLLPPKKEQAEISKFLDRKTAQIDKAIGIKEKQIELLKERRQAVVQKALVRGLNPNVSLKESKIEWLGEIPAHWRIKKLKYALAERNDRSETGEETLFMVSQEYGLVVRADYHDKAVVAQSSVGNKRVYFNDLVFNKLKAHLGVFFKSTINEVGLVSPDYAVYYSTGVFPDLKYLELLFRHPTYIGQFVCNATGIVEGLIRLYTGDLFNIKVPVPPIEEQAEILEYIEKTFSKISTAISLRQQEIEKLKEYKASLINSAVTGKIKVC